VAEEYVEMAPTQSSSLSNI